MRTPSERPRFLSRTMPWAQLPSYYERFQLLGKFAVWILGYDKLHRPLGLLTIDPSFEFRTSN